MIDFFGTAIGLGFAFTSLTLASINIYSHWLLIMACFASLISFLPKAMDWHQASTSRAAMPLSPNPSPRRRGEGSDMTGVMICEELRTAYKAFSLRSGQLMQRETSSMWIASMSSLAIATASALWSLAGPSLLTSTVTSLSLLIAHVINRSLYFSTVVTYRMPGASS